MIRYLFERDEKAKYILFKFTVNIPDTNSSESHIS